MNIKATIENVECTNCCEVYSDGFDIREYSDSYIEINEVMVAVCPNCGAEIKIDVGISVSWH